MKAIGFFNNKGSVGKTSLVYHVACMLGELGTRVVAADLDPQSNLSTLFLTEDRLNEVFETDPRPTIYGAVSPLFKGLGDVAAPVVEAVTDLVGLLPGDLELSSTEDELSLAWPKCLDRDERSFRDISAFARAIGMAGRAWGAEVALVDVGPNLGPMNRAALLSCDHVVVPLGADLLSLQGMRNMGPTLGGWRKGWQERRDRSPNASIELPDGTMTPAGYIVMRHSVRAGQPAAAFGKWIDRMPNQYRKSVLGTDGAYEGETADDPLCLARLKDYRSLMALAQEARKPMFLLKPGDGAFGGHQQAVQSCYADFKALTLAIMARCQ